jgi:tRNA modification GTPase
VVDASDPDAGGAALATAAAAAPRRLWLHNKADLLPVAAPPPRAPEGDAVLRVSARTGAGLEALHAWLREAAGGEAAGEGASGAFSARARQVDALRQAAAELAGGRRALAAGSLDLAAEALRAAHDALGEVTGRIVPDALLGHIFSTFCIGK